MLLSTAITFAPLVWAQLNTAQLLPAVRICRYLRPLTAVKISYYCERLAIVVALLLWVLILKAAFLYFDRSTWNCCVSELFSPTVLL